MSNKTIMLVIVSLGCLCLYSGCKKDNSTTQNQRDDRQVKEKVEDAVEATGDYLSQKKESIMKYSKEAYSQMENDTAKLLSDIKASGKENWQDLNSVLDSKFKAAKVKYLELQDASEENLQKAGEAFNTAADELKDAYQKTRDKFESK